MPLKDQRVAVGSLLLLVACSGLLACGSSESTVDGSSKEAAKSNPTPRLEVALEDGSRLQGSAQYDVYEPHPKAPRTRTLKVIGSLKEQFVTLELLEPGPTMVGKYEISNPDVQPAGSNASVRLNGVEYIAESGTVEVARATTEAISGSFTLQLRPLEPSGGSATSARGSFSGRLDTTCWKLASGEPAEEGPGKPEGEDGLPQWSIDADQAVAGCRDALAKLGTR